MYDSVKQIIDRYPHYAKRAKQHCYLETGTPFHLALCSYFEPQMPYEMAKGRVGDPEDFIEQRLEEMGFFDKPITRGY